MAVKARAVQRSTAVSVAIRENRRAHIVTCAGEPSGDASETISSDRIEELPRTLLYALECSLLWSPAPMATIPRSPSLLLLLRLQIVWLPGVAGTGVRYGASTVRLNRLVEGTARRPHHRLREKWEMRAKITRLFEMLCTDTVGS